MIDLLEEVIVTPRRAFPRLADLQVIERPGWLQIVTPSIKTGGLNEVIYSWLDERGADAAIDAAIATYRDLGLKFRWNAGPGSGPPDLCERLERRGLAASMGRGMARPTTEVRALGDVVEVDVSTVDDYTHVMAAGWNADGTALRALHREARRGGPTPALRQLLRRRAGSGGELRSVRTVRILDGGVVLTSYRGRGLYRALVQARLAHAHARGITLATSHAREATSARSSRSSGSRRCAGSRCTSDELAQNA